MYIHTQVFRSIMERGEGRRRRDVQEINDQTSSKSSTRGRQQRLATAAIGKSPHARGRWQQIQHPALS